MLILNLERVFKLRGIEKPAAILVKHGISRPTISRLFNNQKSRVSYEHLETICTILNRTPNDLFEWQADAKTNLPETHSLYELKRAGNARSLKEMIKDVPMEKLDQVAALLDDLKKG